VFRIPLAVSALSQLKKIQIVLYCHSGLDPWFDRLTTLSNVEGESSTFRTRHPNGCRSKIPSSAGIKSGMTGSKLAFF
jgi:hypothetical protein